MTSSMFQEAPSSHPGGSGSTRVETSSGMWSGSGQGEGRRSLARWDFKGKAGIGEVEVGGGIVGVKRKLDWNRDNRCEGLRGRRRSGL